jgi:hypothetical protein
LEVKVNFTESFGIDSTFSMALTGIEATDVVSSAKVENIPQTGAAVFTVK